MELKSAVRVPFEVLQKVARVSKAFVSKKETEIWWDRGIRRDLKYRGKHRINAEKCIGCGLCARMCPVQCIEMVPTGLKKPRAFPKVIASHCIFCGLCEDACPVKPEKAITLTNHYDMKIEPATWETLSEFVFEPENKERAIEKAKKLEELAKQKKVQKEKKDEQ